MIGMTDLLKPGTRFKMNNDPYISLGGTLNKTAMRKAVVKVKIKNMRTGAVREVNIQQSEVFEQADIRYKDAQFLYKEGTNYVFMDNENYEQYSFDQDKISDICDLIKEGDSAMLCLFEGNPININLKEVIELKVVETEPAVKGDTAGAAKKPAKLETGAIINVPIFIAEGEIIKVNTITKEYVGRVN